MEQREVTTHTPVHDAAGRFVARGYARHAVFDYDRKRLRSSPFALKEWDFYQIADDRHVLQMTVGHVSYVGSVSATLFDLVTGERASVGRMEPLVFQRIPMEPDPEAPHVLAYERDGLCMRFAAFSDHRALTLRSDGRDGHAEVSVRLCNCAPEKDKMVIATPFDRPRQFYLNYKECCYTAAGTARFGDTVVTFGENAYALLDSGRGVWPFRHEWVWGSGSTTVDGRPFGFNIGWGFGDTAAATENMFFYDNRAYKLGRVTAMPIGEGYLAKTRYTDADGRFDLTAEPVFDNDTHTKALFVDNRCHQVWGRFSGRVRLDGGETLTVPPFTAFVEHAVNRW